MTCEVFMCRTAATHKVRVKIPGLPVEVPAVLCKPHYTGEHFREGSITHAQAIEN